MSHHINIVRIKSVNNLLSDMEQDFVFVGGAVVSLYVDRIAEEARPTELWASGMILLPDL